MIINISGVHLAVFNQVLHHWELLGCCSTVVPSQPSVAGFHPTSSIRYCRTSSSPHIATRCRRVSLLMSLSKGLALSSSGLLRMLLCGVGRDQTAPSFSILLQLSSPVEGLPDPFPALFQLCSDQAEKCWTCMHAVRGNQEEYLLYSYILLRIGYKYTVYIYIYLV